MHLATSNAYMQSVLWLSMIGKSQHRLHIHMPSAFEETMQYSKMSSKPECKSWREIKSFFLFYNSNGQCL